MEYLKIKEVLKKQGRSQVWLSKQMDKHPVTVSKWCSNKDVPSVQTVFEIANVLGVKAHTLLSSFPEPAAND